MRKIRGDVEDAQKEGELAGNSQRRQEEMDPSSLCRL